MNSEYHNLPVTYFLNTDYNEYRETGNLLHIEGVSSCTDAKIKKITELMCLLNEQHRIQIICFAVALSAASDEQQKVQYLNQILKEK